MSIYDQPTDPAKRRSALLTDGVDRAPARAMLKAVGFTDEDLAKPLVGVATTWIETMPCNLNQRFLAQAVKQGVTFALFPLKKIETPDDSTVVMRLDSFNDGFLSAFAGGRGARLCFSAVPLKVAHGLT